MDAATRDAYRLRAGGACEYCRLPMAYFRERFSFDHIIARQHGGDDRSENSAFSCMRCNRHKGPNLSGRDPETGHIVLLFHPRQDKWEEHFGWEDAVIAGRTPIGRATVATLNMNDPIRLAIRRDLIDEGLFPPRIP